MYYMEEGVVSASEYYRVTFSRSYEAWDLRILCCFVCAISCISPGTNHHPGNKRYRRMVEDRKIDYVTSKRLDKPLVALDIIRVWRAQDPPGRFLKVDDKTGLWNDVGDKKAREKTSQALREKAPQIRKQQEAEKLGMDGMGSDDEGNMDDVSVNF
jgi:hypothetical protein